MTLTNFPAQRLDPLPSTKRLLPLPALLSSTVPGTNALANTREEPRVIASDGHDHVVGGLLPRNCVILELDMGNGESKLVRHPDVEIRDVRFVLCKEGGSFQFQSIFADQY